AAAHVSGESRGGPTTTAAAQGRRRHSLRAANGLPMEGDAPGVWFGQRHSQLLSGVGRKWRVRETMAYGLERIRRVDWHPVAVAKSGRGDDQVAAGRGKKLGKTRPTGA